MTHRLISAILFWGALGNAASFHAQRPCDLKTAAHCRRRVPRLPPRHKSASNFNRDVVTHGAVPSVLAPRWDESAEAHALAKKSPRRRAATRLLWRLTPSWIRAYGKRVARNHRRSERGMTGSFRDWSHSVHGVRFVILYVLGYLGLSVVAFSCLLEPSWTMIDSLYFAVATFTSVGYGDLSPSTAAGKPAADVCLFRCFSSLFSATEPTRLFRGASPQRVQARCLRSSSPCTAFPFWASRSASLARTSQKCRTRPWRKCDSGRRKGSSNCWTSTPWRLHQFL